MASDDGSTNVPARTPGKGIATLMATATMMDGFDDLTPQDINLRRPFLQIVYPQMIKRDDPHPPKVGQYRLGTDAVESLDAVILRATKYRELEEGQDRDKKITCASADGYVPMDSIAAAKSDKCEDCPFSQWDDDPATGKRKPPKCSPGIAFFAVWPSREDAPFIFRTKKSAVQAGRELIAAMQTDTAPPRPRGPWDYITKFGRTDEKRNGSIVYYAPVLSAHRSPAPADDRYAKWAADLKASGARYIPFVAGADTEEPPAEADVPGDGKTVETTGTPVPEQAGGALDW